MLRGPTLVLELWRVVGMGGVFHRIEVIEVAEELIEAVHGRQKLVASRPGGSCRTDPLRSPSPSRPSRSSAPCAGRPMVRARLADGGHAGADGKLAGDEIGAPGGAARLGVVVGEQHSLRGEPVEVRRPAGHHAPVVGTDIPHADVVTHDDDDVRLALHGGRWGRAAVAGASQQHTLVHALPNSRRSAPPADRRPSDGLAANAERETRESILAAT